jgi:ATP-dependent RNA helicase DeaD
VSLGRERQADPKWLLPMLCRRGGVSRGAIGKIVVLPRESRFEVASDAAQAFAQAAHQRDPRAPDVRIEPLVKRLAGR